MRTWHYSLIPHICNKHLVGMHGEIHKHRHNFIKQYNIKGRIEPVVQIEPMRMGVLHIECVREMDKRGMRHGSDYMMPDLSYLPDEYKYATVDLQENIQTLSMRCSACKEQFIKVGLINGLV